MTKNRLLMVLWYEMFPNVRQFSGEFLTKGRMAAADEVQPGPFGGNRRDERKFFLGCFATRTGFPEL
jgi:hypothetical protein